MRVFIPWSTGRPPASALEIVSPLIVKSRLAIAVQISFCQGQEHIFLFRLYSSAFQIMLAGCNRLSRDVGVSLSGDIQNAPGRVPVAPPVTVPWQGVPALTVLSVFEYCEI